MIAYILGLVVVALVAFFIGKLNGHEASWQKMQAVAKNAKKAATEKVQSVKSQTKTKPAVAARKSAKKSAKRKPAKKATRKAVKKTNRRKTK